MKKFSKILVLGAVLSLPLGVSASNKAPLDSKNKSNAELEDKCKMKYEHTDANGKSKTIKGDCAEVMATLERLKKLESN